MCIHYVQNIPLHVILVLGNQFLYLLWGELATQSDQCRCGDAVYKWGVSWGSGGPIQIIKTCSLNVHFYISASVTEWLLHGQI